MIDPNETAPAQVEGYSGQVAGMNPGDVAERNRYMLQQYVEQLKQAERIKANPELMKVIREFIREEQVILSLLVGDPPVSVSPLDGIAIRVKRNGEWLSLYINEMSYVLDSEIRELSWGDQLEKMLSESEDWVRSETQWVHDF